MVGEAGDLFAERRAQMVAHDIAARGIRDERVLDAIAAVPRERFVTPPMIDRAYDDAALPIDAGQTISQPYVVALMAAAAEIGPADRVLEVGAGSGYGAAVLGHLAAEVWSVERVAHLAESARARIAELGLTTVHIVDGDGSVGWPDAAPFDAIVVTASGPDVPPALVHQLDPDGGRLVMPIGRKRSDQHLVRVRRQGHDLHEDRLGSVRFVPLVGAQGWRPRH